MLTRWIERGDFSKTNWGRAALAGFVGATAAFAFGWAFGKIPGVDRVLTPEGQALVSGPFGTVAGSCVDFAFGTDAEFEVFCGIKIKPGSQVPQRAH